MAAEIGALCAFTAIKNNDRVGLDYKELPRDVRPGDTLARSGDSPGPRLPPEDEPCLLDMRGRRTGGLRGGLPDFAANDDDDDPAACTACSGERPSVALDGDGGVLCVFTAGNMGDTLAGS